MSPWLTSLMGSELPVLITHCHRVFAECHRLISPDTFFSSCVNDHCNAKITDMLCQSLEAYATLCRARGVCTNWRNATEGLCGK